MSAKSLRSRHLNVRCPFDDPEPAVVPRLWSNETVVCIASGPSLHHEDVDYCRGKTRVIAVNDGHRLAPWADALYSSDQRWWEFYKGVPSFAGAKFGIKPLRPDPRWRIDVLGNGGESGLSMNPSKLCNGRNSGYAAINLAVLFGASRVILLGYDMQVRGKRSHFFGDHPTRLQVRSSYASYAKMFQALVKPIQQAGVQVINCSRETALHAFPRLSLREAMPAVMESVA